MRNPRGLLPAALTLAALSFVVLVTEPAPTRPVAAMAPPSSTTTSTPPTTTTTTTAPPTTTTAPRPTTTAHTAPPVTTTRPPAPPTTASAAAPRPSGKSESCGWQWDAIRVDDGSSNEVTMTLDAARRPNETVTIHAAFGGPDTPDASQTTMTDGAGEATAKLKVSEDKRDWTITISASFAAGGTCPPETFTLDY